MLPPFEGSGGSGKDIISELKLDFDFLIPMSKSYRIEKYIDFYTQNCNKYDELSNSDAGRGHRSYKLGYTYIRRRSTSTERDFKFYKILLADNIYSQLKIH